MNRDARKRATLKDDDIGTRRALGRRGALGLLSGAAAAALANEPASAAAFDQDAGATRDPPSSAPGSDSDAEPKADPPGSRRLRNQGRRGPTDRDSGAKADIAGAGRGPAK